MGTDIASGLVSFDIKLRVPVINSSPSFLIIMVCFFNASNWDEIALLLAGIR
ncbi:MAG: hypothetical protein ACI8PW_000932 [Methylophilaceae bacterium]|jgi:hypothetical protein